MRRRIGVVFDICTIDNVHKKALIYYIDKNVRILYDRIFEQYCSFLRVLQ